MQPDIIERSPETVLYVREVGEYTETPGKAFKKLTSYLKGREVKDIQNIYGMGLDNPHVTDSKACRFDACARVKLHEKLELDASVQKKEMEGGRFAVFTYNGPYSDLTAFCSKIFQEWFPTSGYQPTTRPLFCEYTNFFEKSREGILVYVPKILVFDPI